MAKNIRKIYVIDYIVRGNSLFSASQNSTNKSLVRQTPYYPFNVQTKHPVDNWIYKWGHTHSRMKALDTANVK